MGAAWWRRWRGAEWRLSQRLGRIALSSIMRLALCLMGLDLAFERVHTLLQRCKGRVRGRQAMQENGFVLLQKASQARQITRRQQ